MKQQFEFSSDEFSKDLLTKRVVELRIDLREAASIIGISASTLSRLENKKLPDIYSYYYCCKWLGVDMMKYFKKINREVTGKRK